MPTTSTIPLTISSVGDTPNAEDILKQLELILASPEFLTTRRLRSFLNYVIKKTLAGTSNTIKQYSIGIDVYDRAVTFDPKADPLVRIEAGRLRRCLKRYYENNSEQAVILIEIPRGAYVPHFSLFSKTVKDPADNVTEKPRKNEIKPPVVAAFPFSYIGDEEYEYLADDLPEELTSRLSQFPDLHVKAYCTLHKYKDQLDDRQEVATSLGIDIVMSGTLRIANNNLHLNLRLFMIDTGEQIWAETFDETITPKNIYYFENKILEQVTGKVADEHGVILRHLTSRLSRHISKPSSFEAVLQNRLYQQKMNPVDFQKNRKSLEYAVQTDPDNATIHALLGQLYFDAAAFEYAVLPNAIELGIKYTSNAVSLDPNNQYAHHCKAYAGLVQGDRETMVRAAERIVKINSNAASMITYAGFWFCLAGEYEKGMKWFRKGTELNPVFPNWLHAAPFFFYIYKEDFERALLHAYDFELPGFFWGPMMRTAALGLLGRTTEAKRAYTSLVKIKPDFSENARSYIESFVMDKILVDTILKGIAVSNLASNSPEHHSFV